MGEVLALVLLVVAAINIFLGVFVLIGSEKKSQRVSYFFGVAASVACWAAGLAFFILSTNQEVASVWVKLYYISAAFIGYFLFLLSGTFSRRVRIKRLLSVIYTFLLALIVILSVSSRGLIQAVEKTSATSWSVGLNYAAYSMYGAVFILFVITGLGLLADNYIRTKSKENIKIYQIKLVFFAILLATLFGSLFNLILPWVGNYDLIWVGPLFSLFFVVILLYATVKQQLFNVKLVVARTLAYGLSIGLVISVIVVGSIGLSNYFTQDDISASQLIYFSAVSAIAAIIFQPIKRFFDRFTNRVFYRDAYDPQMLLDSLNKTLVSTVELDRLLKTSANTIADQMKLQYCVFGVKETENTARHIQGTKEIKFEEADIAYLRELTPKMEETIISASNSDGLPAQAKKILRKYDIEVLARLVVQGEGIGYLLLGPRKSGSQFTDQDLRVISIIADEIAISIQNSLRFEEIEAFNITLQQKITAATDQLQKSNEKLKALDEAKDEFISMASHQLRTPLTSVKGYISMLLEGDAGKLTTQQQTFLDQAFLSSQRMVYLIADLLNVSRLKTGKFVIERRPVYLPDLVESEIAQLYETAKSRDLKLEFKAPKKFPMLSLDETKTRQVVMNFSDNAIYYTPKGGKITIEVKEVGKMIEFTVTDTGIGVPKSEQHHLFSKFYRAGNAKKARPDGTGLGLFMAKKVIAAQGGAILFHTEEGKGSTFGFTFPLDKIEVTPDPPEKE